MSVVRPRKVDVEIQKIAEQCGGKLIYKNLVCDHIIFQLPEEDKLAGIMLINYTPEKPHLLRLKSLLGNGFSYLPSLSHFKKLRPWYGTGRGCLMKQPFPRFEIYFMYEELDEFIAWVIRNYYEVREQYPMASSYMPLAEGKPIHPHLSTKKAQEELDRREATRA